MADETPAPRPEYLFSTTLWGSLGALEAVLAFVALYALARWVGALRWRLAARLSARALTHMCRCRALALPAAVTSARHGTDPRRVSPVITSSLANRSYERAKASCGWPT